MLFIIVAMALIVAGAGLVVAVVALPHRGRTIPNAPWANDVLAKVGDRLRDADAGADSDRLVSRTDRRA